MHRGSLVVLTDFHLTLGSIAGDLECQRVALVVNASLIKNMKLFASLLFDHILVRDADLEECDA